MPLTDARTPDLTPRRPRRCEHPGRPFAPRPSRRRSMHPKSNDQVLERLPNGELAWLRLNPHTVRIVEDGYAPLPDDVRYWLTEAGTRALRMAELFGTAA